MFESLFGAEMPLALRFVVAFIIVLGLIGLTAYLVRRFGGDRLGTAVTRGRAPRLAVIEGASIDARRRLVLIRRDNVEHLIMIGGPTDVVVELNIARAATPTRDAAPARQAIAAEPLPKAAALTEGGMWPLQPQSEQPRAARPTVPEQTADWQDELEEPPRPSRHVEPLADLDEELSRSFAPAEPVAPPPRPIREPVREVTRMREVPALREVASLREPTMREAAPREMREALSMREREAVPMREPAREMHEAVPMREPAREVPMRETTREMREDVPMREPALEMRETPHVREAPPIREVASAREAPHMRDPPPIRETPMRETAAMREPPSAPPPSMDLHQLAANADQNLAEMAQRLEAALRRPVKPNDHRSADVMPQLVSPPQLYPHDGPASGSPGPMQGEQRTRAEQGTQPRSLYDSLEQEMASLLGRPNERP